VLGRIDRSVVYGGIRVQVEEEKASRLTAVFCVRSGSRGGLLPKRAYDHNLNFPKLVSWRSEGAQLRAQPQAPDLPVFLLEKERRGRVEHRWGMEWPKERTSTIGFVSRFKQEHLLRTQPFAATSLLEPLHSQTPRASRT
jgi:hypothetical protein